MANDEVNQAKAEVKAAQAKAKAMRPWYKKKRIMLPLILVVFIAFTAGGGSEDLNKAPSTNERATTTIEEQRPVNEQEEAPKLSPAQQNAVRSAKSYLSSSGFSRQGLIDQLSSEFGDKYPVEDATVAVDSLNIDYNEQAKRSAEAYLKISGFSCQSLSDQLSSDAGDKYTKEQAESGAKAAGAC